MTGAPRLPGLTLSDADQIVLAALEVGAERGFPPLAVAVIDVAGEVVVLRRSDGGMPMTSRIAVAKARSALVALKPSGLLDQLPPGIIDTAQHLYGGNFVPRAGASSSPTATSSSVRPAPRAPSPTRTRKPSGPPSNAGRRPAELPPARYRRRLGQEGSAQRRLIRRATEPAPSRTAAMVISSPAGRPVRGSCVEAWGLA